MITTEKENYDRYYLLQQNPEIFGYYTNPLGETFPIIRSFGILPPNLVLSYKEDWNQLTWFSTEAELEAKVTEITADPTYYSIMMGYEEDEEETEF